MNNLNQDFNKHESLLRLCPSVIDASFEHVDHIVYRLTADLGVYFITLMESDDLDSHYINLSNNDGYVQSPVIYPGDMNCRYNFSIEERISLHVV